ncbi:hypothetical protein HELRODRAFT_159663 [Helobdella robusta]|uniref:Uncharacterized protein n=1 Tax=Helobdella robusta TaxID=6412 RepID=T1EPA4_HELRO|nr:hypothetical protein HELRODRAFT_159663 [Helobdella robusta]ESO13063.1 hypothetical protein HELRODRAFT_159663 [Helobdella robusta]
MEGGAEKKSNKSAVVIIPPEEVWSQIQDIRSKHDKSYKRWMPHINLVYPFVHDDPTGVNYETCKENISSMIKKDNIKSFQVNFDASSFQHFKHKSSCTLWLKPLRDGEKHEDIVHLQSSLHAAFPEYNDLSCIPPDHEYTPHLSLGQFNFGKIEEAKIGFKEKWRKIEFAVDRIYLISRKNFASPFEIRHAIMLL